MTSLDFLFKVMTFANFGFKNGFEVMIFLGFIFKVMVFAYCGLKVANFLGFHV